MTSILIVDDEAIIRNGLKSMLSRDEAFTVVGTACDGREALRMVDQWQPDIVITDINMPNMDGLELLERIHEADEDITIILLTGYDQFSYVQRALRAGATDYLLKPISPRVLLETLTKAANRVLKLKAQQKRFELLEKLVLPKAQETGEVDVQTKMMAIIQQRWNDPDLNMDMIADELYMNYNYLRQVFKAKNKLSFVKFIREMRLQNAARLLVTTDMQIKRISEEVGYVDSAYFSICFRDAYGVSPREYRDTHRAADKTD